MFKKIFVAVLFGILGAANATNAKTDKVFVCHQTSSEENPVVLISISSNAVQTHLGHGDILLPEGESVCRASGDPA